MCKGTRMGNHVAHSGNSNWCSKAGDESIREEKQKISQRHRLGLDNGDAFRSANKLGIHPSYNI